MPREYHHIQHYEKEILELKSQGYTLRAIGEKFGFTYKQMHNFITRYNANQRKQSAGIMSKPKAIAEYIYGFKEMVFIVILF